MTLFTTTLTLLWFVSGAWSFIYWWTKDNDLETSDIPFVIFVAVLGGPINYILGYAIFGELSNKPQRILIRRKLNPNQRKKVRMIIKDSNKGESNE